MDGQGYVYKVSQLSYYFWVYPGALDMSVSLFYFFLTVSASMWRSSILIWQYCFISVLSLLVSVEKIDVK